MFWDAIFSSNEPIPLSKANHYSKEENNWRLMGSDPLFANLARYVYFGTNLLGDPELKLIFSPFERNLKINMESLSNNRYDEDIEIEIEIENEGLFEESDLEIKIFIDEQVVISDIIPVIQPGEIISLIYSIPCSVFTDSLGEYIKLKASVISPEQELLIDSTAFQDIWIYNYDEGYIILSSNSIFDGEDLGLNPIVGPNDYYNIGIYAEGKNNITIQNCILLGWKEGVHLSECTNSTIKDNILEKNIWSAVKLWNTNDCNISNNYFSKNSDAIYLRNSSFNTVKNNEIISQLGPGINLWRDSNNNTIMFNFLVGNYVGITSYHTENNTISNNTVVSQIRTGIRLASSDKCIVKNNTVCNNRARGFDLDRSSDNIISNNNISGNGLHPEIGWETEGMYLFDCSNNTIFNNIFNNSDNVYDWYGDFGNIWNISKKPGTNIIGGPFLGGNFWSDYTGIDEDYDGLGDTPYDIDGVDNQDHYPLIYLNSGNDETELTIEISGGFGITLSIKNIGNVEAQDVTWNCSIVGGIFNMIDIQLQGTIDILQPGEEDHIRQSFFGLGNINITADASALNADSFSINKNGRVIFIFIKIL